MLNAMYLKFYRTFPVERTCKILNGFTTEFGMV